MPLTDRQKMLAWALLFLCFISIPVAIFSKGKTTSDVDSPSPKSKMSMLRQDHLMVLRLDGMIYNDEAGSSFFDRNSPTYIRKKFRAAADDSHIKGILLRVNSPGGTVAMSQEILSAVQSAQKKNIPVVVSMGDVAASGGYYIACSADRIFAEPGTLTGSIGVIMHLLNLSEIEKKIGIQPLVIKSGAMKDIGTMDRAPTPEERELLQSIIMDSYDMFVTAISAGRKMPKDAVKKLADGRIYSGRQALSAKLIDELGGYEESISSLQKLARERFKASQDYPVEDTASSFGFISALLRSETGFTGSSLFKGLLPPSFNAQFHKQPMWIMQ
jgi:protease-4